MARVYVSIGSNIDRDHNVRSAIEMLDKHYRNLAQSQVYETEAVGFQGDHFYNLVVSFDADETPQQVAAHMHEVEDAHGRVRGGEKFAPRTLDLDLLLYDDLVLDEGKLQLPRDEIEKYAFVLRPLAEMAPRLQHPVSGKPYAELWAAFDADSQPLWPVALD